MRLSLQSLCAALLTAGLLAGCGGSGGTVSVPVVERPAPAFSPPDTAEAAAPPVPVPSAYDTVQAQRLDRGRMWSLQNPPTERFRDAYGVELTDAWLTKAQRGALKFGDGCSASFVSPNGLVMTNHHCAREHIAAASRAGEGLLDDGFYAERRSQERRAGDLHVDQLVEVRDVTQRVFEGLRQGREAGTQARGRRVESLQEQMTATATARDSTLRVEVDALHQGARYTAYTYRRYEDVRLVMAPELRVGYFGGTADNFTYPRYVLDVAFFRVYAPDGTPLQPAHHFAWAQEGAAPGDPVFAVGHPASTSRQQTVAQLDHEREKALPSRLEALRTRSRLLQAYIAQHPDSAARYDLRNAYFTMANTAKSLEGQLRGLHDPYLRARRGAAVQALQDSIRAVDSLRQQYGQLVGQIDRLQQSKAVLADKAGAFVTFANLELGARVLVRALHAYYYDFLRVRGAPPDRVEALRDDAAQVRNWPPALERRFLVAQFEELRAAYGPDHPTIRRLFTKRTPEALADRLVETSALMDSTAFMALLDEGYRKSVIEALAPMFLNTNRQMQDIRNTEQMFGARLARARVSVYGARFPPNATGSLRLSGGRVQGYRYNGTMAPPFTTFHGLYDRYAAHNQDAWALPPRWRTAVDSLELGTPFNLVSTVDISGGSSGSPLLNADQEVVGVVFDSNVEALPNEYLYRTRGARAVAVDARGILEALRTVYNADRLVQELTATESASDE